MVDSQIVASIVAATVPTATVFVGILINNARLGDLTGRFNDLNNRFGDANMRLAELRSRGSAIY